MILRNRSPINQACANEIANFIESSNRETSLENISELRELLAKFDLSSKSLVHVSTMVDVEQKNRGIDPNSVSSLVRAIYID